MNNTSTSSLFRKGVNLVELDIKDLGKAFWGVMIGKPITQKICTKVNCTITSHLCKCDTKEVESGSSVLICTKPDDSESIYVNPSLPRKILGATLYTYVTETRPVEAWITFFVAMNTGEKIKIQNLLNKIHWESYVQLMIKILEENTTEDT